MKIHVPSIPEGGKTIVISKSDPWFQKLVTERFQDFCSAQTSAEGEVRLFRTNANVSMNGKLDMVIHPPCDRCGQSFELELDVPLYRHLTPFFDMPDEQREEGLEVELNEEDLDYSTYKNEEIDLAGLVAEEFFLAQPMRYLCEENCRGLCAHCGANLNEAGCKCSKSKEDSPFAVLKGQHFPTGE